MTMHCFGPPLDMQARAFDDGIEVDVLQAWIVHGEDRLSYASIVRLIEWCREYHWKKDILSISPSIDSIVRSVEFKFLAPILAGSRIHVTYRVANVRKRLYALAFCVTARESGGLLSECNMVCSFYDASNRVSIKAPFEVNNALAKLKVNPRLAQDV